MVGDGVSIMKRFHLFAGEPHSEGNAAGQYIDSFETLELAQAGLPRHDDWFLADIMFTQDNGALEWQYSFYAKNADDLGEWSKTEDGDDE